MTENTAKNIQTKDPLFTSLLGEKINSADQQKVDDFNRLSAAEYELTHGADALRSMIGQAKDASDVYGAQAASNDDGGLESVSNAGKNMAAGFAQGLIDTGAFAAGLTGLDSVGEALARASKAVGEAADRHASMNEQMARKAYQGYQRALMNRLDRQEEEDRANGKSEVAIAAARIAREHFGTITNSFKSGQYAEAMTEGLGNVASSLATTGGLGTVEKMAGKGMAKLAPNFADRLKTAYLTGGNLAKDADTGARWALSNALMEGGGSYGDVLLQGRDASFEDLMANSPAFAERVAELMKDGVPQEDAMVQARDEISQQAAKEAGIDTGLMAAATSAMTAGMAKPFNRVMRTTKGRAYLEGATQLPEEALNEGVGQYASNAAVNKYLDKNQKLYEGIGESSAQGVVGAVGMTAPSVARTSFSRNSTYLPKMDSVKPDRTLDASENQHLINTIEKNKDWIDQNVSYKGDEDHESIQQINETLKDYSNALYGTEDIDTEKCAEMVLDLNHKIKDLESMEDNHEVAKGGENRARNLTKASLAVAKNLRQTLMDSMQEDAPVAGMLSRNKGYAGNEAAKSAAAYFTSQYAAHPDETIKAFEALPQNLKEGIASASFASEKLTDSFNNFRKAAGLGDAEASPQAAASETANTQANTADSLGDGEAFDLSGAAQSENQDSGIKMAEEVTEDNIFEPEDSGSEAEASVQPESMKPQEAVNKPVAASQASVKASAPETVKNAPMAQESAQKAVSVAENTQGIQEAPVSEPAPAQVFEKEKPVQNQVQEPVQTQNQKTEAPKTEALKAKAEAKPALRKLREVKEEDVEKEFGAERMAPEFSIPGLPSTAKLRIFEKEPNNFKFAVSYRGKTYAVPEERGQALLDTYKKLDATVKDPEDFRQRFTQAQAETVLNSLGDIVQGNLRTRTFRMEDGTSLRVREDGVAMYNGTSVGLTDQTVGLFFNPQTNPGAIQKMVEKLANTLVRADTALPSELHRKGKYIDETGVLRPLAMKNKRQKFAERFPALNGKAELAQRPVFLALADHPLQAFRNIFKSPDVVKRFLRMNHSSRAGVILRSLFSEGGNFDEKNIKISDDDYGRNASVASHLLNALRLDSEYMTALNQGIGKELTVDKLRAIGFISHEADSETAEKIRNQVMEACALAGLHWVATIAKFPHQVTDEELKREDINPELQDADFKDKVSQGVLQDRAVNHFSRTFKQMFGLVQGSKISRDDFKEMLDTISISCMESLLNAGVIETKDLTVYSKDENYQTVGNPTCTVQVAEKFKNILGFKPTILMEILCPESRSNILTAPPDHVIKRVANTKAEIPYIQQQEIQVQNHTAFRLNEYAVNALAFIGGADGLLETLGGGIANEELRKVSTFKHYQTMKGKNRSITSVTDAIGEFLTAFGKDGLKTERIYFNHKPLADGRNYAVGALSPHMGHLQRDLLSTGGEKLNMRDEKIREDWFKCIAQKFGAKTSKEDPKTYMPKAKAAFKYIEDQILGKDSEYGDFLKKMVTADANNFTKADNYDKTIENRAKFMKFLKDFKDKTGYEVNYKNLSALTDMVNYALAKKNGTDNAFDGLVTYEIDCMNSGPRTANNIGERISYTKESPQRENRTGSGRITEYDTVTQNTEGSGDLHSTVSKKAMYESVRERLTVLRKRYEHSPNASYRETAQNFVKGLKSALTLFKAVGWVSGDINKFMDVSDLAKMQDSPLVFERELSKHLTTIINYGSGVKGTSRKLVEQSVKELYKMMSDAMAELAKSTHDSAWFRAHDFVEAYEGPSWVLDTETTSTDPKDAKLVQISLRKMDHGKEIGKPVSYWVKLSDADEKLIPEMIGNKANPLTEAYAKHKGEAFTLEEVLKKVKDTIGDAPLMGHNIKDYDFAVLNNSGKEFGIQFDNEPVDSLYLAKDLLKFGSNKLEELAKAFKSRGNNDFQTEDNHLADVDTHNNIALLRVLYKEAKQRLTDDRMVNKEGKEVLAEPKFNGINYSDVMNSLKFLCSLSVDHGMITRDLGLTDDKLVAFWNSEDPDADPWTSFISKEALADKDRHPVTRSQIFMKGASKGDLRNYYLTGDAIQRMTNAIVVIFGEPAQAAVTRTIGAENLRLERCFAGHAGILNVLAQGLVEQFYEKNGTRDLTPDQEAVVAKIIQSSGAVYDFDGTMVSIAKWKRTSGAKPLVKGKHFTSYPSRSQLADIGVAGGACIIQGAGDGRTLQETYRRLNGKNVNIMSTFDSVSVSVNNIAEASRDANEAVANASKLAVIEDVVKRGDEVGEYLMKKYGIKAKTPQEALTIAIANLAEGKRVDGKDFKQGYGLKGKDVRNTVIRYLDAADILNTYIPDLIKVHEEYLRKGSIGADTRTVIKPLEHFLNDGKACVALEKISLKAFAKLPETIQHFAGYSEKVVKGSPLTKEESQKLLDEVNASYGGKKKRFESIDALQASYVNCWKLHFYNEMRNQIPELKDPKVHAMVRDYLGIGPLSGNSGIDNMMTQEAFDTITKALTGRESNVEFQKQRPFHKVIKIKREDLKEMFNDLGSDKVGKKKKAHFNRILGAVYNKIYSKLPRNLEVTVVNCPDALPPDVAVYFTNSEQKGLYMKGIYLKDGDSARIYIIDRSRTQDGSLDRENGRQNRMTLVHECIHAVLAETFVRYYQDKKQLPDDQVKAIENMEKLLDTFMDKTKWEGDVPKAVQRVRQILETYEDPAERLDEATAYILSNLGMFNAISSKYLLKNDVSREHAMGFRRLLAQIKQKAIELYNTLLGILGNSVLARAVEKETGDLTLDDLKGSSFLHIYGANAMVAISNVKDDNPGKGKKSKNQDQAKKNVTSVVDHITRGMISNVVGAFNIRMHKNLEDRLEDRIRASIHFDFFAHQDERATEGISIPQEVSKYLKKELDCIERTKEGLNGILSSAVDNPKEVSDTVISLMDPDAMTPETRYNLFDTYQAVVEKLDPYFLVPDKNNFTQEEADASKEVYDLIRGESNAWIRADVQKPVFLNSNWLAPAVFYALAFTNPEAAREFNRVLPKEKRKQQKISFEKPLEILEKLGTNMTEKASDDQLAGKSMGEIKNIVSGEGAQLLHPETEEKDTKLNRIFKSIDRTFIDVLFKPFSVLNPAYVNYIKDTVHMIQDSPLAAFFKFADFIRKYANRHFNEDWLLHIRELYGKIPGNSTIQNQLKKIKGTNNRERMKDLQEFPEMLKNGFKKTKITRKMSAFMHRMFTTLDLACLATDETKDLILDDQALDQAIKKDEDKLRKISPDFADEYFAKIEQYADAQTGRKGPGHIPLWNPIAIARLLGTRNLLNITENSDEVRVIDRLMTFYCIKRLSKGDLNALKKLYEDDAEGMNAIQKYIQQLAEDEMGKAIALRRENWKNNYKKGWLPHGSNPRGSYALVPKSKVKEFYKRGYDVLGDYEGSDVDPSEHLVRMWCPMPHDSSFQEGVLQAVAPTAYGFHTQNFTRNGLPGSKVLDPDAARAIAENYDKESDSGDTVEPLFADDGSIVAFERSIPYEDRMKIAKDNDLFSALADISSRQDKELSAPELNAEAAKIALGEWQRASEDERKTEFIDLLHSKNPTLSKMVNRLDHETRELMENTFPDGRFWVRKDEAYTYTGYFQQSLTNMWDGTFFLPKKVQEQVVKILELLVPNGRARYYVSNIEKYWQSLVAFAKDTIVIRSGVVAGMNATANILLLHISLGIPLPDIYKYYKENLAYTQVYNKLSRDIRKLKFEISQTEDPARRAKLQHAIHIRKDRIKALPIYELIKNGEYSSISSEGARYDEADFGKQKFEEYLASKIDRSERGAKGRRWAKEIFMTRSSNSYKTMAEAVNLGDWLAKSAGYRYLTEHSTKLSKEPLTPDLAKLVMSTLIVDYDQFMGGERDWMNKSGLTWFMLYKYRMIPAAMLSALLNPTRMILGTLLQSQVDLGGTPLMENLITKGLDGDLSYSIGPRMLFTGLMMHPMAVLFGLLA